MHRSMLVSRVDPAKKVPDVQFFLPEQSPVDSLMIEGDFPFLGWEAYSFLANNKAVVPAAWWRQGKKIVFIKAASVIGARLVAPVMEHVDGQWNFSHQQLPSYLDDKWAVPFFR